MKKIEHYNSKKSISEIKKMAISLDEFKKQFSKKDLREIEKEKRYYEVLMKLRSARKKKGFTQEKLSILAKVPRTTITKIESGNRNVTINTLMNIADALGKELVISFR